MQGYAVYLRLLHLVDDGVPMVEEQLAVLLLVRLPEHHSAEARQVRLQGRQKVRRRALNLLIHSFCLASLSYGPWPSLCSGLSC